MKVLFLLTIHNRLDHLEHTLDVFMSQYSVLQKSQIVVSTSYVPAVDLIKSHKVNEKFNIDYIIHPVDSGYGKGCVDNVILGVDFVKKQNYNYDYLVSIEGDQMFYSEHKLLTLINQMNKNNKHILLDPCQEMGEIDTRGYMPAYEPMYRVETVSIYSKWFIDNCYPTEIYEDLYNFEYTGFIHKHICFEHYLSLAFNKKNNLNNINEIVAFFRKHGLYLTYNRHKCLNNFINNPDQLTSERFIKYGIYNGHPNLESTKLFIQQHLPYLDPKVETFIVP